MDEGYIKYINNWEQTEAITEFDFIELINCRNQLKTLNLIGVYQNNIAFGNVSCRINNTNNFIISGTQTGALGIAQIDDFSLVYNVDIEANTLFCKGPIAASSEALTHAAIYLSDAKIMAVLHVHHPTKWKSLLNKVTTIEKSIAYGTPQLAKKIGELLKNDETLKQEKIFVTAGHEDGIFAFGETVEKAFGVLSSVF